MPAVIALVTMSTAPMLEVINWFAPLGLIYLRFWRRRSGDKDPEFRT